MSHKQMPRLGSAIASTILSLCSAVSLIGIDQAQAAVLHYNFQIENGVGNGSFKVDTSSLTGIGYEEVFVSDGILSSAFYVPNGYGPKWVNGLLYLQTFGGSSINEFNPYPGATAKFYQGEFLGLQVSRSDQGQYKGQIIKASWSFDLYPNASMWTSRFSGSYEESPCNPNYYPGPYSLPCKKQVDDAEVYYTLVPEPLTAGGTALALAGLSWLKHKKKKAA